RIASSYASMAERGSRQRTRPPWMMTSAGVWDCWSCLRKPRSGHVILVRDVAAGALHHQLELIRAKEWIVAQLEREPNRLLELAHDVVFALHGEHRHVGVQLHEQRVPLPLDTHPLHAALHAAEDRLGGEHAAR